jgi:streptomycin 6-kinase
VIHERWRLVNDGSFTQYRRFVEPVRRADGSPAVLRLAPPEELDAAEWFSGHGVVRVLEIDRASGALLLERALPARTWARRCRRVTRRRPPRSRR